MYFEITREIVEEHHRRLRDAAHTPSPRLLTRVLGLVGRDRAPAQVIPLPRREIERLAA
jgi:hypothetical protein